MIRTVVLDSEAVQALLADRHPKHRRAVAHLQVIATRKLRHVDIEAVVPTAVRVEAGWDRSRPAAALINRLRIANSPLDAAQADVAASLATDLGVSVADAHLGATVNSRAKVGDVTVLTSDPKDVARTVAGADRRVVIVRI